MPVLMSVLALPVSPLISQEPTRLLTADAFLPHCPASLSKTARRFSATPLSEL